MSFEKHSDMVEEGDTVVLYFGRQNINPIDIDKTKTFQSKFGAFHHKDIVGKRYGCKMRSKKGWGYLLRPTPELWTVSLPHRTQILYTMDISMITMELQLRPGSIVVESGTGSGSLSHAMIRTIKPTGHLHTFDFHEQRVNKAREEFDQHYGKGKYVTCAHADACVDGFSLEDVADAVFLDLPTPWEAVPHAKRALKKSGGRLCSFSPCIEQVQRTSTALRKAEFCEVKTVEVLVRSLAVQTTPIPEMVFDCDLEKLENEAKRRKCDDEEQKENNGIAKEEKQDESKQNGEETVSQVDSTTDDVLVVDEKEDEDVVDVADPKLSSTDKITGLNSLGLVTKTINNQSKKGNVNMVTCNPTKEVTGHTGYLTFATLLPAFVCGDS